jgi:hypothetical protein
VRDDASAEFFAGAGTGKLILKYCRRCSSYGFNQDRCCPRCFAVTEWRPASGQGTVYSWSVNHQFHPAFAGEIPYVIAAVELKEGPLMVTRLVDIEPDALHIGFPVKVRFIKQDQGEPLPVFSPDHGILTGAELPPGS